MAARAKPSHIADFAELVVRDFLRVNGYTSTLTALNQEKVHKGNSEPPAPESWYRVSEAMGLADLLMDLGGSGSERHPHASIIEAMTKALLQEHSVKMRRPPSVRVLRTFQGSNEGGVDPANSSIFSMTGSMNDDLPQEAMRISVSAGTLGGDSSSLHDASTRSRPRTTPSAPPSVKVSPSDYTRELRRLDEELEMARSAQRPRKATVPTTRRKKPQKPEPSLSSSDEKPFVKRLYRPMDPLMSKRPEKSSEYWIPMPMRSRMMMKEIQVLKRNVEATNTYRDAIVRNSKWINVTDLDHNKTQERLGSKHQMKCALCEIRFSDVNLKLAVPFKAIVDLRQSWERDRPNSLCGCKSKQLASAAQQNAPQCYDIVRVCVYCAQFFNDQDSYRPSFETEVEMLNKKRQDELAAKAALWWDPLRKVEEEQRRLLKKGLEEIARGRGKGGKMAALVCRDSSGASTSSIPSH